MVTGIGVKMRKGVIYATRSCFRSLCNHPFIVAMLCILILLHRASPFVFSLLVSASPVIVCTLLLLGTLLSFGQLNIPEIEIEEKITRETILIKTGVAKNVAFSENDSLYAEGYSDNKTSEAEEDKLAEARKDDSTNDSAPLMDRKSVDLESDNEENRDKVLSDDKFKQKNEWNKEGLIDQESVRNHSVTSLNIEDRHLESETEKSEADSFDSERVNVDSLDSPPRSPWKRVRVHDDDDDERDGDGDDGDDDERDGDDDALDSGSDGAESSSPDASMADIMPMLDELHPLLDEENPQPIQISRGGSDAGSEMSSKSSSRSSESDDDIENNMDVEEEVDDNDDGEDEEVQDNKESASKSVITWTEEDQKNLMDLGSSELERNQRLESLILRRRARKNLSMVPERNLIDFESNDLPFHITPITTMRQNPFDLPNIAHSSYSGLPPIPGSAPSVLIPRRNPFDIPYDASEEKPNLSNDGFQEDFATVQSREPFFKRHESFNVGPSTFSHGRQDVSRFRPYFVPDRSISEESNYSPYQRNSSELSDSKVSSVPETESVGSVENLEDLKFTEENKQELGVVPTEKEEFCEETELITEKEVTEKDGTHDVETVPKIKHVSEDVGHGSQSSEEEDDDDDEKEEEEEEDEEEKEYSEFGELEERDFENDTLQFQSPDGQDQYKEEESVVQHKQNKASDCESGAEDVELRYNGNSSSSSFSDVSESFFPESRGESSSVSEERRDDIAHDRHLSTQTSTGSTDLNISSPVVDDVTHKEPVYDSSPSAVRKNLSSSSISSDVHVEADQSLPPVLVKRTVSFVGIEPEDVPRNIEMLPEASVNRSIVEHESYKKEISMIKLNDVKSDVSNVHLRVRREDTSEIHQIYENEDVSKADPSYESREASAYSMEENSWNQTTDVAGSSSQKINQVSGQSSKEKISVQLEEEKHLVISDKEKRIPVNLPDRHLEIKCAIEKEENIASPSSDVEVFHEANEKLISTPSADGGTPLFYDVVMHEPFKHLEEVQVPNTPVGSFEEPRDITSLTIPQLQLLNRDTPTSFYSPRSPDFISMISSASGEVSSHIDLEPIIEEVDEIKEIDEGTLSELDSVSDFNITQQGSDSNASAKHVDSVGKSAPTAHYSASQSMELVVRHQETLPDEIVDRVDASDKELNDTNSHDSSDRIKSLFEASTNNNESALRDVVGQNLQDTPVISEVNVETDSFSRKADSVRAETEFKSVSSGASKNSQLDDVDDVASEIEAQIVKDIEVEVTQSSVKDMEKPIMSESLQSGVVVHETTGDQSEDKTQNHANSSVINSIHEMQSTEARPDKDSTSDHKQVEADSSESYQLPDSVYQIQHRENSREVQLSSESHAVEAILKEDGPSKQMLYEQPNRTKNVESKESKVDTPSSSVHMELSVKEISLVVSEKSVHEVRISHSTKSDKGKLSKSSSSSSSSSSESSSSDSE